MYWITRYLETVWAITVESAPWVVFSLAVGGLVREFLPATRLQGLMNGGGVISLAGAVLVGALLPICSCGVVPLAISFHRAGVRIGPVMAFTAATPMINPAAVILAMGLLGPQLAAAYVALGLILPFVIGLVAERWADPPRSPARLPELVTSTAPRGPRDRAPARLLRGLRWGFADLGPSVGFYLGVGVLLAGLIMAAVPTAWMERYLGGDAFFSLLAVGALGAAIYVCAVAHIPLVATLLAGGAAPGAAMVFLVTGTATNLPELIALYKTIGRRTVIVYVTTLVVASFAAGLAVNAWLLPGFEPVFDPVRGLDLVERSAALSIAGGGPIAVSSGVVVAALGLWGAWIRLSRRRTDTRDQVSADAGCACCKHDQPAP